MRSNELYVSQRLPVWLVISAAAVREHGSQAKPDFGASSLAVLLYSYLLSNKNCRPLNQEFISITEDTGLCLLVYKSPETLQ